MAHPALEARITASLDALTRPAPLPEGRMTCPTCHGSGTVTTRMGVVDGAAFPDEDTCTRCDGAGHVCRSCGDIGIIDHGTVYGEYDSYSYCTCGAGSDARERDRAERAAIDAEESAVALSWAAPEPVLAGADDDLNAQPF